MDDQTSLKRRVRGYVYFCGVALSVVLLALAAWWRFAPGFLVSGHQGVSRAFGSSAPAHVSPKAFGVLVGSFSGDNGSALGLELTDLLNTIPTVEAQTVQKGAIPAPADDKAFRRAAYDMLELAGARVLLSGDVENTWLSVRCTVRRLRSPDYQVFAYFPETLAVSTADGEVMRQTLELRLACEVAKWSALNGSFETAILAPRLEAARQRLAKDSGADTALDPLRRVLADALLQLDGVQGGAHNAREALPLYRVLVSREQQGGEADAYLRVNLGLCLMHLARTGDLSLAAAAVETLQSALPLLDSGHGPMPKARVEFALGAALELPGDAEHNPQRLVASTGSYRLALNAMTREKTPWLNAVVNKRLGGVLNERFRQTGDLHLARQARDAFTAALTYFDRQRDSGNYAWCQRGLGQAKSDIAAKTGDIQQYEEAAVAFAQAASAVPREGQPRYFGSLQFRQGVALYNAAKRFPRGNGYEKALEAFDLATSALDSGQDSWEWLRSHYYRGVILSDQGAKLEDAQRLAQGAVAFRKGLDTPAIQQDSFLLGWFSSSLGRNLIAQYELLESLSLLEKAQQAFDLSQSLTAKDSEPDRWASLQHNLAWIAAEKALASGNAGDMEHAAAMYRQAREARRDKTLDENFARQISGEVSMLRTAALKTGNHTMLLQAEALSRDLAARSADSPLPLVRSKGKSCLGAYLRIRGIQENNASMVEEGLRWLTQARQDLAGGVDPQGYAYLSLGMAQADVWLAAGGGHPDAACGAVELVMAAWSGTVRKDSRNAKELQAVLRQAETALRAVPSTEAKCLADHAQTIAAIKAMDAPGIHLNDRILR